MTRPRTLLAVAALAALAACNVRKSSDDAPAANDAPGTNAATATAPSAPVTEPTAEDISNYPLDMDKMRKLTATMQYLGEAAASDPSLGDAARMGANESTAQTIAKLEGNAAARAALRKAGWSAKDYVWTTAAFLQAGMMQGVLASGTGKLPPGHSPKNIEFLKMHQKEIDQLGGTSGGDR